MAETPPFLQLKLLSTDDAVGSVTTWRGRIGGQQPLLATVTLGYDARVAALAVGAAVAMEVHGQPRAFTLLSIAPAPDAKYPEVLLHTLPGEPAYSPEMEFEVTGGMVELAKSFELGCCANQVLQGTNSNPRFIPN